MRLPRIKVPQKLTRFAGKLLLKGKKASPEICIVVGVLAGGAAIVTTGIATWNGKEKFQEDVRIVKANTKKGYDKLKEENPNLPVMTENDRKKCLMRANFEFGKDILKFYWKPVVLAVTSTGLIWGGARTLRKELTAMTISYATLMDTMKKYRERVIADVGAEKDQEYMYGVDVTEAIDAETGEVTQKIVKKSPCLSQYARWFNEGKYDSQTGQWLIRNYAWNKSPDVNFATLKSAQIQANARLKANGFLFLNDVYKILGLPMSVEGQIVGWDMCGDGDHYVDFGVFPEGGHQLPVNRRFCNGEVPDALLEFNVDGPILGALEKTFGEEETCKLISQRW